MTPIRTSAPEPNRRCYRSAFGGQNISKAICSGTPRGNVGTIGEISSYFYRPKNKIVSCAGTGGTLDPDAAALFDREANVFASEILFQNYTFHNFAADEPFEVWTPIRLAKKFNASLYSYIRQYVSKSDRCCVVLILNPPELIKGAGFKASLRRVVFSRKLTEMFGDHRWAQIYTPDDQIGRLVPLGKRRSFGKQEVVITDSNGDRNICIAESFTQTHQVFVLIHVVKSLGRSKIIIPAP